MWKSSTSTEVSIHTKSSDILKWSIDGTCLISITTIDNILKTFEFNSILNTLKSLTTIQHSSLKTAICFHPMDKNKYGLVGDDKYVEIWDTRHSRILSKISCGMGNNLDINWSRNGKLIAISNEYEYIGIIDVISNTLLKKTKYSNQVRCMAWSYHSDYLILGTGGNGTSDSNGFIELLSVNSITGELTLLDCMNAHTSYCSTLCIDSSYKYMAVVSADYIVSLWDLAELACFQILAKFDEDIRHISFSPSGVYIAVITFSSSSVNIYNTLSGENVHIIECKNGVKTMEWNPVFNVLIIASDDKQTENIEGQENVPRFGRDRVVVPTLQIVCF